MIKLLGYKVNSITIYPFGGIIETDINLNIRSLHLAFISISGVLMQLFLMLLPIEWSYNYDIFLKLNISLIIYNLLPIIPTDGYKLLISLIENLCSYRKSIIISQIVSSVFLFIFFYITRNIIIFTFLYIYDVNNILNYHHLINKFLLERYLNHVKYPKNIYIKNIKEIHKNRNNYIIYDKIYQEEELLKIYFMSNY